MDELREFYKSKTSPERELGDNLGAALGIIELEDELKLMELEKGLAFIDLKKELKLIDEWLGDPPAPEQ